MSASSARSTATKRCSRRATSSRAQLWRIRESIPEAQFTNVKHDVSVPVSKTPELIERAGRALKAAFPESLPYVFGHVGDGNLHYNVGPEALLAQRAEVNRIVYDAVGALGGSISAEHGLGQLKRDEIRSHKSALEMELMRALKKALDPQGLMNPGKAALARAGQDDRLGPPVDEKVADQARRPRGGRGSARLSPPRTS